MSAAGGAAGRDLEIPLPPRRRFYAFIPELRDTNDPPDPRGRRVYVAKPNTFMLRLAEKFDAHPEGSAEQANALADLAAELFPELSLDEAARIEPETVMGLMQGFKDTLDKLAALAKNGAPPLAKAGKGSNSETPSPTRSRGSRRGTGSRSSK